MSTSPRDYLEGFGRPPRKQCFVILPYQTAFSKAVEAAIRDACVPTLSCEVARNDLGPKHLMSGVLQGLYESEFVVADVTGLNPNVLYELGIAHCFKSISRVIILTQDPKSVPTDLLAYTHVTYSYQDGTHRLTEDLREIFRSADSARDSWQVERRTRWAQIKTMIESSSERTRGKTLNDIAGVIKDSSRGDSPVVRLWGSSQGIRKKDEFMEISKLIGAACADRQLSISGTAVQPETLEYHALLGVRDQYLERSPTGTINVYLHRNGTDMHDRRGDSLVEELKQRVRIVDVRYPESDGERLSQMYKDVVGLEKSGAHDARLGSLFQCDAVVLLGSTNSARHLIQLMGFMEERRLRAARPILFVPLPWVGGTGARAFDAFTGAVEELDPASLV